MVENSLRDQLFISLILCVLHPSSSHNIQLGTGGAEKAAENY
jgi:hypothetical protein